MARVDGTRRRDRADATESLTWSAVPTGVVGVVPAAGKATRIEPLPCSKEIYPVGFRRDQRTGEMRPQVASHHLFDKFRIAGIPLAYVILRRGKWDIPAYFGEGDVVGVRLAYLAIDDSLGPANTLDRAFPFVAERIVAFGFPDILFGPDDVFDRLLTAMKLHVADAALALYVAQDIPQSDMIDVDADGRIRAVVLKPAASALRFTWACAVWGPNFSGFMHDFLAAERAKGESPGAYRQIDARGDLPVGAVIKAAVDGGLHLAGVPFPGVGFLDIGTPEKLVEAVRMGAEPIISFGHESSPL